MVKIGIPRALSYYRYFPFWKTLLEHMEAEVVVSPPTGKRMLEEGVRHCVDDICIPVKLYYGHVVHLKDRVDLLFVSRMVSVEKSAQDTYTCPKLIGLPDMIKSSLEGLPTVVEFLVDVQNVSPRESALMLGKALGAPASRARKGLRSAMEVDSRYQKALLRGLDPETAMKEVLGLPDNGAGGKPATGRRRGEAFRPGLRIALVGHEYLIHDPFIGHDLPRKLERLGAEVLYMTGVPAPVIEREIARYPGISWSYEKELLGAASHFLGRGDVDGVMLVTGFACGPDSIIGEIINREVRRETSPPLTTLVLDEHTGEAGVNTRVEAFVDLIRRSRGRS